MKIAWIAMAGLLGVSVSNAADIVVYNTYGAGDTYNTFGWAVSGSGSPGGNYFAQGLYFTPSSTGTLSTIDLSLNSISGTNAVTLSLYTVAGGTTGTLLESWSLTGLTTSSSVVPPTTLASVFHSTLDTSSQYILFAAPGANDTNASWAQNSIGAIGPLYRSTTAPGTGGSSFNVTLPAVRISVSPVPEPSTVAMTAAALGLWALARRRR